jgi:hypothetical protein
MRRPLRLLLTMSVAVAFAAVVPAPTAAWADDWWVSDGNKGWVSTTGTLADNVGFATTIPHWSAVVMLNGGNADYDMSAVDPATGQVLASSAIGAAGMDVIAVNSIVRPPGQYLLKVKQYSGGPNGFYNMWFRQRGQVLPAAGTNSPIQTLDAQWVMIRDVYLKAGECLAVRAFKFGYSTGDMMLMSADPARPAQGRTEAVARVSYSPADNGTAKTLRYTAPTAGWYGFMIVNLPTYRPGSTDDDVLQYQRSTCLLT